MSVGDKRQESHPAREGGQAHKKTGTFPSHQGGKESRPQGKDHALHSQQTLPTLQQTYTEKHTCSHTHRHTIHTHMSRHTDSHTGLPVVDTRASVLSSESDWGWGEDQLHPGEHQLLQVGAGQRVPRQQLCGHREPPDSGDQE